MTIPNQGLGEQLPGKVLDFLQMTKNAVVQGSLPTVGTTGITVNGTNVYYLQSFIKPRNVTYGWAVKFTSVGTIDVKVELEEGWDRPTTEGASDTAWTVADNKLTSNALFQEITDASLHITAYSPNATPYGRIKVTGLGSNNAATLLAVCKAYAIKNNQL